MRAPTRGQPKRVERTISQEHTAAVSRQNAARARNAVPADDSGALAPPFGASAPATPVRPAATGRTTKMTRARARMRRTRETVFLIAQPPQRTIEPEGSAGPWNSPLEGRVPGGPRYTLCHEIDRLRSHADLPRAGARRPVVRRTIGGADRPARPVPRPAERDAGPARAGDRHLRLRQARPDDPDARRGEPSHGRPRAEGRQGRAHPPHPHSL